MKTIILAAVLAVVIPATGFAQVVVDNQHTTVGSTSGARSSNNQPVTLNQGNNSPNVSNFPGIAPTIYAPGIVTGNVCALGASAGVSFIGTGITAGGTWESKQCEQRQKAALLYNMGMHQAANEMACDDQSVYNAMKRAGTPCAVRADWEPKQPAPVVQAAPTIAKPADPAGCGMRTYPDGKQYYVCL